MDTDRRVVGTEQWFDLEDVWKTGRGDEAPDTSCAARLVVPAVTESAAPSRRIPESPGRAVES